MAITVGGSGGFRVTIDDREVRRALSHMERALVSAQPAWAEVGEHMLEAVDTTFVKEGARDEHQKWPDLAKSSWAMRPPKKRKEAGGRILQVSARLRRSIWRRAGPRSVKIGTNVDYASKHQYGLGVKPRPFLFVTSKDWDIIGKILLRHYLAAFPRGPRP